MKVSKEQLIELSEWLRPISHLAAFARSVRGEGETDENAGTQQQQQQVTGAVSAPVDPFADIDLDELPDETRLKVEAAQKQFALSQKAIKDAATEKETLLKQTREHQARADRNFETLRKHNLVDTSGNPTVGKPGGLEDNPAYQEILQAFIADGIDPKIAAIQAKMHFRAGSVQQKHFYRGMAPLANDVVAIQANSILERMSQSDPAFSIKEVGDAINTGIANLVKSGTDVNEQVVTNVRNMVFGDYVTRNPDWQTKIVKSQNVPAQQPRESIRRGGGGGIGFSGAGVPVAGLPEGPTAANAETALAATATMEFMRKGLPKKGKK